MQISRHPVHQAPLHKHATLVLPAASKRRNHQIQLFFEMGSFAFSMVSNCCTRWADSPHDNITSENRKNTADKINAFSASERTKLLYTRAKQPPNRAGKISAVTFERVVPEAGAILQTSAVCENRQPQDSTLLEAEHAGRRSP